MVRVAIVATLVVLSAPASAQFMDEVKGVGFGVGCTAPVNKLADRLGACLIDGEKFRVWCPNGKIFERAGDQLISSSVVRSMCEVNQVL